MQKSKIEEKKRSRRAGFLKKPVHPQRVKELTINNINLYNEMSELNGKGNEVCEKYERIIQQLETIIKELQNQNKFLKYERSSLITENLTIKSKLKESNRMNIWETVSQQFIKIKKVNKVQPNSSKNIKEENEESFSSDNSNLISNHFSIAQRPNSILEQSNMDELMENQMRTHNHHIDDRSLNSPITPTLGVNYSLVECTSIGNDAPLRVFYLFLLQNKYPSFLEQFEEIVKDLEEDPTYQILPILSDNKIWTEVLKDFIEPIKKGQIENELQLINFLNHNKLMDMLLISVLRSRVYYLLNETKQKLDDEGNSSFYQGVINHEKIFYGLANQFNLSVEKHKILPQYIFYPYQEDSQSQLERQSILQKQIQYPQSLQISLNNNRPSQAKMSISETRQRKDILFIVKHDKVNKTYEFNLDIKLKHYEEEPQNSSFNYTEPQQSEQQEQYSEQKSVFNELSLNMEQVKKKGKMYCSLPPSQLQSQLHTLRQKDENSYETPRQNPSYKYEKGDYLMEKKSYKQ